MDLSQDLVRNARLTGLTTLQIGISHHLTPHQLLSFVSTGSNLTVLDVFYDYFLFDWQNDLLVSAHGLPCLIDLTVRHQGVASKDAFHDLFDWLSCLSAKSRLEHLSIVSDDGKRHNCRGGACLAAVAGQHPALMSLTAAHISLGPQALAVIAKACPCLDEIVCAHLPRSRTGSEFPSKDRAAVETGISVVNHPAFKVVRIEQAGQRGLTTRLRRTRWAAI